MDADTIPRCWLCGGNDLQLVKAANLPSAISGSAFRVTDAGFGQSGAVYLCHACGFRMCPDFRDALRYYEVMEDPEYETTRGPRALQAAKLLSHLRRYHKMGRLLDIGAGSGILVEQASKLGYAAEGIEPSDWLAQRANEHGIPVHHGVLPNASVRGPFDIVTLIDVIEHVSDPVGLLRCARDVMAPDGIGLLVTPDVESIAARVMGERWWHYRVAHIGYFTRTTIQESLRRADLIPVRTFRPSWYFSLGYLIQRLTVYSVLFERLKVLPLEKITIPLNLFDSMATIFRRAPNRISHEQTMI